MKVARVAVAVAILFAASGCAIGPEASGKPHRESETVELGKAEMIRVDVGMGAGELKISGGSDKLLEAGFEYRAPEFRPVVTYEDSSFRGKLTLRHSGDVKRLGSGHGSNTWDLRLNSKVPTDLEVSFGAGQCDLDLGGMMLRGLEVHLGAGKLNLDLRGEWAKGFSAVVRGGVGEANVYLPRTVGVIAEAVGGIGQIIARGLTKQGNRYVNAAYEKSPVTIRLDVKGGIGQINLIGDSGSATLPPS